MFTQGLWEKMDPLLQLPHMDEDIVKKYRRSLTKHQIKDASLKTFLRLTSEERAKLDLFSGDKAKEKDLERAIKQMPLISVEDKVHTDGENMMTAQDVISFEFKLTYDLVGEKDEPGYVCSKHYPFLKKHNWIIFMTDKSKEKVFH